jgi:hypothetical protein
MVTFITIGSRLAGQPIDWVALNKRLLRGACGIVCFTSGSVLRDEGMRVLQGSEMLVRSGNTRQMAVCFPNNLKTEFLLNNIATCTPFPSSSCIYSRHFNSRC